MLTQLSRYLIQFQQVYIPSVGTLRLVQLPARLDVGGKQLFPPESVIQFAENGWLSKHQLWYFAKQLHFDDAATRNALDETGAQFKAHILKNDFVWNGIGTFSKTHAGITFTPQPIDAVLKPVYAERVLRQGAKHAVLVGDQLVISTGNTKQPKPVEHHRQWSKIVSWAIVILALFFIIFYLYQYQFGALASGLRQRITTAAPRTMYMQ